MTGTHPHTCLYCNGDPTYHRREGERIARLFDSGELAPYTDDGIVKTILRKRLAEERDLGEEQTHGAATD